jgi:probable phosphoglycerate mutase
VIFYCDGAARGNPGPAGIGVSITDDEGRVIHEIAEGIGHATNNVAEYSALIAGLEWCADNGATSVLVRSDSHLLVEQMKGNYRVKNAGLKPLAVRAKALERRCGDVAYEHVRREFNKRADELANIGVDAWLAGGGDTGRHPRSR